MFTPKKFSLLKLTGVALVGLAVALNLTAEEAPMISLWKNGAPGSEARRLEQPRWEGPNLCNVHDPSITLYLPKAEKATGTAVIIAPGGGHSKLCLGHEGDSLGQWFADHGIAGIVLRYRLSKEEGSTYTLQGDSMNDTRRAIRTVRYRSQEWNIQPDRIGIVGFSAGGELAAYSAMESDNGNPKAVDPVERMSSRPDFQGLIYPGKSGTFTVHAGMPPAFIAYGYNDRPDISTGMAQVYLKYKEAGVPCEMHVYSNAGHGFGYRPGSTSAAGDWPLRFREWLIDSKLLTPKE
ncbi:MAG: alpha/beta hydrolase [Verrucomicrobiae bacterium]|nr:alpha/beta hydrolase [Verrucomicrobiae bacterium]